MRVRPSTVAIAAAVALVFSGLYLAERSLREAERVGQRADAQELAAVLGSFLEVQAEALGTLHGLYVDGVPRPPEARFRSLITGVAEHLGRFGYVWATDSAGVVLFQARFTGLQGAAPLGLDVDTLRYAGVDQLVARARRSQRTVLTPPLRLPGGDSGVVMAEPIVLDGTVRGFVAGSLTLGTLRAAVAARRPVSNRQGLLVVTAAPAGDTVLYLANADAEAAPAAYEASVPLPGGGAWRLVVYHAAWSRVRVQLWGVALAALTALAAGAWHERRQSRRITARSRELEHLSEELLRANKAKSEFLANVSHELRTPLNAIVGFTELLRDGVYGELAPRQAGPVQRIEASASHLRSLVDQVLDLAKMTAGRLEVQRELVDLRQVVLDIGTEMEPLFAERGLTFAMSVGASVPKVRTDPTHVRQILVNLLGNAIKFTDAGGITVRTRLVPPGADARPGGRHAGVGAVVDAVGAAVGSAVGAAVGGAAPPPAPAPAARAPDPSATWVAVQVADTGPGIARRDQERIFDEFEQVNAGSRGDSDRRGTGLGLPISRRLARLLGGELTVESQVGKGSEFTLWLPVG